MNTLTRTMKENKVTRKEISKITGLSLPTLRKYLKSPELFPCKNANQIMKKLKTENYEETFRKLFNIKG
jgi:predicted transcriptional regulator|tara:strand:- start:2364 stop:2570 length:207 start_codon:yes stop_codon:yes gene_type:complete